MKTTRRVAIAWMAFLCIAAVAWADAKAEPGPAMPTPAERLVPFLKALRDADHPSTAMAAYARGCAIDRTDSKLQNAYMRKMLQFGQPKISFYAARVLVRLEPHNGTAWGVVGYVHAKRGEMPESLAAGIRAATYAPANQAILNNTGQLLAWFDNELAPPKLPDAVRRMLMKVREDLAGAEPFAKAYARVTTAYRERAKLAAALEKQLAAAQTEALEIQQVDAIGLD